MNVKSKLFSTIVLSSVFVATALFGQKSASDIRFNQLGFLPDGKKIAVINSPVGTTFKITTEDKVTEIFSGKLTSPVLWMSSNETVSIADFTNISIAGKYAIVVNNITVPFVIDNNYITPLSKAAVKAFYYNRASIPLEPKYSGKWADPWAILTIQL